MENTNSRKTVGLNTFHGNNEQQNIFKDEMAFIEPTKSMRRRKIRALNVNGRGNIPPCTTHKSTKQKVGWCIFVSIVSLLTALALMQYKGYEPSHLFHDFVTVYTNQYMSILHNKINYCDRDADYKYMFQNIRKEVLNQEVAIGKLELAMRNDSSFRAIALIGTSGVGKSLTARLVRTHFPWTENVQTFMWNVHVQDDISKYQTVRKYIRDMSLCGRNLIIIDNMTPCDYEFVGVFNNLIMAHNSPKHLGTWDTELRHMMIIYIINLNAALDERERNTQFEAVQNLGNTTSINFRSFDQEDLKDCINKELKSERMMITDKFFSEILDTTEVQVSGCKTTRSKVLIYGDLIQSNEQENLKY